MTKFRYFLVCMAITFCVQAQQVTLKKWTLSNAGTVYYSSQNKLALSQTIGQSSLVRPFGNGNVILLQGFQHSIIQNYKVNPPRTQNVSIFPNPSSGIVTVNVLSDHSNKKTMISLFNTSGRLISQQIIDNKINFFDLDYSFIPKGAYVLRIVGDRTGMASVPLILK